MATLTFKTTRLTVLTNHYD